MAADKLPAMQWYPGDWRKDPGIQACDLEHRGAWFEVLQLMHESPKRGHLMFPNGTPMDDESIARILGIGQAKWEQIRSNLLSKGVASVGQNGELVNRRMARDNAIIEARRRAGRKGGRASKSEAKSKQRVPPSSSSSSSSSASAMSGSSKVTGEIQKNSQPAAVPRARGEPPDEDPAEPADPGPEAGERARAVEQMRKDTAAALRSDCPKSRRQDFGRSARSVIHGDAAAVWRDPGKAPIPWQDRPALLRLALDECAVEKAWGKRDLRAKLKLVILRELAPFESRRPGPPPGSEAAGAVDEYPGRYRTGSTNGLQPAGKSAPPPVPEDPGLLPITDADLVAWQQANPGEAAELRKRVEDEVPKEITKKVRDVSVAQQLRTLIEACIRAERRRGAGQ